MLPNTLQIVQAQEEQAPHLQRPKASRPPSMQDDQETVKGWKREVTRLRLMKEGLDEETKRSLEQVFITNKYKIRKRRKKKNSIKEWKQNVFS